LATAQKIKGADGDPLLCKGQGPYNKVMKPTDLEKGGFNFKNQGSDRGLSPTLYRGFKGGVMKIIFLIIVFMFPIHASAAGWAALRGENSKGQKVVWWHEQTITEQVHEDDDGYTNARHIKAYISFQTVKEKKEYSDQDCLYAYREIRGGAKKGWLTCSSKGPSPIAGVTYHSSSLFFRGKPSEWKCVLNCNEISPKILTQDQYE